jgi:hypothetical protein
MVQFFAGKQIPIAPSVDRLFPKYDIDKCTGLILSDEV